MLERTMRLTFGCVLALSTGCSGDTEPAATGSSAGTLASPELQGSDFKVAVEAVTSSRVTLSWPPFSAATDLRVYIGPEPPELPGRRLPLAVQDAVLPGTATGHTVTAVAAATDLFALVIADEGRASERLGFAHARTEGGPRAPLETPLREVHAYAPNVLALVLQNPATDYNGGTPIGNTGADWAAGAWTVTRSLGAPVAVSAVRRHSIPVGQPDYPVGYWMFGDDDIVDIDHRVFLLLDEPIGGRELLQVNHAGAPGTELDVRLPFSDRYLETPVIQVNQLGYNPRASRRFAYVSGWMGDGGSVDLSNFPALAEVLIEPLDPLDPRRVAASGLALAVRATADGDAGGEVREIDLSGLAAAEGVRYRVRLPGVGVSWPTAVSEEAAARAFYVVWRGLFLNRWHGDLGAAFTEWTRPPDHGIAHWVETGNTDPWTMFDQNTSTADPRALIGGHHDAGDFDIRPFHVVVAQYLMRAYELDPSRFEDGQLTLPESGNGIPDVLDEALFSVAAWRQLQNADGSVRMGVESWRHPAGYYYASDDQLAYWTYDPVVWHTAYTAGLFAQAAYLVAPFDGVLAGDLETAARDAYAFAAGRGAPDEYLLFAASELWRLTGEAAFRADYEARWDAIDVWGRGAFDNVQTMPAIYPGAFTSYTPAMADFVMGYYTAPGARANIAQVTLAQLDERAANMAGAILNSAHAHRHGRAASTPPDWGQSTATGRHGDMLYQRLQVGALSAALEQDFFDALSLSADYVLGCNPASYVYITGLGSRHPEQPLHTDSLAFIQDQGLPPIPGIPVYGPVRNMPGAYWYAPIEASFYPNFAGQPLGQRLSDTRGSVNMNEFTVWENQAPLAELFAALLGEGFTPPPSWFPGGDDHRSTLTSHTSE